MRQVLCIPLLLLLSCVVTTEAQEKSLEDSWLERRFGRTGGEGHFSTDPHLLPRFVPSGVGWRIYQAGDVVILHNKALYWSHEENPDTSKDMLGSVLAYRGEELLFAARGYKFDDFVTDPDNSHIQFHVWSGVMGPQQIKQFQLDCSGKRLKCSVKLLGTR